MTIKVNYFRKESEIINNVEEVKVSTFGDMVLCFKDKNRRIIPNNSWRSYDYIMPEPLTQEEYNLLKEVLL